MEDFAGPIEDPEVNRKFREAMEEISVVGYPGASMVYECNLWPPGTIGVSQERLFMSSDLFAKAGAELTQIKPGDN